MNIELGGGTAPTTGYINLDPIHGTGAWRRLAQDTPWPAADWAVDYVRASHVMEHIPAGAPRIAVMNEAWRVLRPGGHFTIVVPLFPYWPAVADPTHLSFWCEESFSYFDGSIAPSADYGIRRWTTKHWSVREHWEGTWVGEKPLL